ncbi:MAG: rod shape-determining protein MreD [Treponema sp.]|nr:rod shape-determining protein MreD [Treponema sp.]
MKNYFVSAFVFLCVILVQTAILSNILFLPVIPDLALLCLLFFATQNGKISGEINGFVSGLFLDFLSGAPLGFNCIYRSLIGYITGAMGRFFSAEGIFMTSLYAFFGTLLKSIFIHIILVLFPHIIGSYPFWSLRFLYEIIANIIFAPLMFKFLNLFSSSLVSHFGYGYKNEK